MEELQDRELFNAMLGSEERLAAQSTPVQL